LALSFIFRPALIALVFVHACGFGQRILQTAVM
jgi:hypothetical protein